MNTKTTSETPKGRPKLTNDILEDHGEWLLIDISTPKLPDATMAIDRDVLESHEAGRIYAKSDRGHKYIYARFNCDNLDTPFHKSVIDVKDGMECDHIHHGTMNFIDNRRSNLRSVTSSQNSMNRSVQSNNTSGISGVSWSNRRQNWVVVIMVQGNRKYLGSFDNIDIAIGVRQQAEREYFGEYSYKVGAE